MVQWIRICLLMQGTWVQSLVREDSTCFRATKPMGHNYQVHGLQLLNPICLEPMLCKRSHHNGKPVHHNEE